MATAAFTSSLGKEAINELRDTNTRPLASWGKISAVFSGILGGREVRSFVNEGTENPCPAATEIIYALDVLPRQFTEIMRKYM